MNSPVSGSLLAALEALTTALQNAGVPAVVVGGVAVSLLARRRFTRDIDTLVDQWIHLEAPAVASQWPL